MSGGDVDENRSDDDDRTPGYRRDEVDVVAMPYHANWSTFALLLHGPVIWAAHFLFVYLAAEWACAQGGGIDAAVVWTLWPTLLAGLAIAVGTAVTAARWRQGRQASHEFREHETLTTHVDPAVRDHAILGIGMALAALSLLAVVAVGAMALVLPQC